MIRLALLLCFLPLLTACTSAKDPAEIQKVWIQRNLSGNIEMLIVLSNREGVPVAASGRVFAYINAWTSPSNYEKLWIGDKVVTANDFKDRIDGADQVRCLTLPTTLDKWPISVREADLWVTFDIGPKDLRIETKQSVYFP